MPVANRSHYNSLELLTFRSSSNLAAAYGIAVTLTMVITTVLAFFLVRERWGWSMGSALGITFLFLVPELAFTAANAVKIEHGGWFPLLVGSGLFVMMTTWKRGREVLALVGEHGLGQEDAVRAAQEPLDLSPQPGFEPRHQSPPLPRRSYWPSSIFRPLHAKARPSLVRSTATSSAPPSYSAKMPVSPSLGTPWP